MKNVFAISTGLRSTMPIHRIEIRDRESIHPLHLFESNQISSLSEATKFEKHHRLGRKDENSDHTNKNKSNEQELISLI